MICRRTHSCIPYYGIVHILNSIYAQQKMFIYSPIRCLIHLYRPDICHKILVFVYHQLDMKKCYIALPFLLYMFEPRLWISCCHSSNLGSVGAYTQNSWFYFLLIDTTAYKRGEKEKFIFCQYPSFISSLPQSTLLPYFPCGDVRPTGNWPCQKKKV